MIYWKNIRNTLLQSHVEDKLLIGVEVFLKTGKLNPVTKHRALQHLGRDININNLKNPLA